MHPGDIVDRLRACCKADGRVVAAFLYGSFATGEADALSDVDCALFFDEAGLADLDRRAWVEQLAPVELWFADDFGHHTAIFDGLVRGEFHFSPRRDIGGVARWRGNAWLESLASALLVDRTGELAAALAPLVGRSPAPVPEQVGRELAHNLINLVILGANLIDRGELARALDVLSHVQRKLLHLARLVEGTAAYRPTPSRRLEQEVSATAYERFRGCTSRLQADELRSALTRSWRWGGELMAALDARHPLEVPPALLDRVSERLAR